MSKTIIRPVQAGITLLIIALLASAAPPTRATLSGPATGSGGAEVTVTGTSPGGEGAAHIGVEDDDGDVDFSIEWNGENFTIRFYMPAYDEGNPNAVDITVTPASPNGSAFHSVGVVS